MRERSRQGSLNLKVVESSVSEAAQGPCLSAHVSRMHRCNTEAVRTPRHRVRRRLRARAGRAAAPSRHKRNH